MQTERRNLEGSTWRELEGVVEGVCVCVRACVLGRPEKSGDKPYRRISTITIIISDNKLAQ